MDWTGYILNNALFLIQMSIKNPASLEKERHIIQMIADACAKILATSPTS